MKLLCKGKEGSVLPHLVVAVDELLLGEHLQLASCEVVRTLQRSRSAERPARPAGTLKNSREKEIQESFRCRGRTK